MKKTLLTVLLVFIGMGSTYAQTFDFDIVGIYLPVEYIQTLERTKHNPTAWASVPYTKYPNTVYIVDVNKINASGRYDGTARVYLEDIFNFRFESAGGEVFLTDHHHNRFRKLPGELYLVEHWWEIVSDFVGNTVLGELIKSGDITLENGIAVFDALDGKRFHVEWQAYDPKGRRNLSFEAIAGYGGISLEISPREYIFYDSRNFGGNIVWSKSIPPVNGVGSKND